MTEPTNNADATEVEAGAAASDDEALEDIFLDTDSTEVEVLDAEEEEAAAEADEDPAAARIAELEAALAAAQEEAKAANDRLIRKAADMENARRRHQRERDEQAKFAGESILKDFVPILDDLQRALEHAQAQDGADGSLLEGIEMVSRKYSQTLAKRGVTVVESLGQAFDPQFHEAIQQRTDESVPHNTIVQEFQRGYLMHDRLLRPALVVVAQGGPPRVEEAEDAGEDAELGASESTEEPSVEGASTPEDADLADSVTSGDDTSAQPDVGPASAD